MTCSQANITQQLTPCCCYTSPELTWEPAQCAVIYLIYVCGPLTGAPWDQEPTFPSQPHQFLPQYRVQSTCLVHFFFFWIEYNFSLVALNMSTRGLFLHAFGFTVSDTGCAKRELLAQWGRRTDTKWLHSSTHGYKRTDFQKTYSKAR